MRRVVECVVDRDSFFEIAPLYGPSQITGLARMNGQPVGILANDPQWYAGAMTAEGAQKVKRHIDLCDTFHLPMVSLVDEPGFMIGPEAEQSATIRYGTAVIFALMQCTVPLGCRSSFARSTALPVIAHFGPGGMVFALAVGREWRPAAGRGSRGSPTGERSPPRQTRRPSAGRSKKRSPANAQSTPEPRALPVHDMIDPRHTRPVAVRLEVDWIQPQLSAHTGPRAYTIRP